MSILQYFSLKDKPFSIINFYTIFKLYEIYILIKLQKIKNLYDVFVLINDIADIYLYIIVNNYIYISILIYIVMKSRTIYYTILIIYSLIKNKKIVEDELNQYIDNIPIENDSKYVLKNTFKIFDKMISFVDKNLEFR